MIGSLRGLLGIVVLLGFAILFHEFGHFLWAKICGVRVLRFSVGFGKFIFSWKRNGTEYGVAWFPVGGYVMLHGAMNPETGMLTDAEPEFPMGPGTMKSENGPPEKTDEGADGVPAASFLAAGSGATGVAAAGGTTGTPEEAAKASGLKRMVDAATSDSTALYNQPYLHKLLIYGGGVVMNWITAIVAIGLFYSIGFSTPKPAGNVVGHLDLPKGVSASTVPLKPGDKILKANGTSISTWEDFLVVMGDALEKAEKTKEPKNISVVLDRPDKGKETVTLPSAFKVKGKLQSPAKYVMPHMPAYVENVIPNMPADKAGIRSGDVITSVSGKPIHGWGDMADIIKVNAGKPLAFVVKRGDKTVSMTITPTEDPNRNNEGQIGILAGSPNREFQREPVWLAFYRAPKRTIMTTVMYVELVGGVVKRLAHFKFRAVGAELGGPIQIAQLAYRSAKRGLSDFLWLFFSFNIALAVFNLLPIPLLDGSLLFFATYEAIAGKPLPPKLHVPLLYAGLVLIVLLFIAVSINDAWRMFG